jgi:2-polyprenyl-3-methyl-5-hydroxy-6-metoxy-1,4-benzoquinol methylase
MSREDDRSLRFYNEVLGLDHLHYGIWTEEEDLTLANMKVAQLRYEDLLISKIPASVQKVLDVGCGTSAMTQRMLKMGLEVHGLSPDETQKNNFTQNLKAPFYHSFFEEFESKERFDCLIMSESAQYIPLERLFENGRKHLRSDGHVMICDYFVMDNAHGVLAKSGHNLTMFRKEAEKQGFKLQEEIDITEDIAKTLDLAKLLADRVLIGMNIMSEKFRKKHPILTKIIFRLFRKKWAKVNRDKILIDSKAFKEQKRYLFLLYRIEAMAG